MPDGTIYYDIQDGANAVKHLNNGQSVTVLAIIDFLPGDDTGTLFQNAQAQVLEERAMGSACPGITQPTYLEAIEPDCITANQVKLRLIYKGFRTLQIEIGTVLTPTDSNTDNNGDTIVVSYDYPSDYAYNPNLAGRTGVLQGGFIQKMVSETTFCLKYPVMGTPAVDGVSEAISASTKVLMFAQAYVGMVNADVWESAPGGKRTWLCETVRATSQDGGLTYDQEVTFHYRAGSGEGTGTGTGAGSDDGGWDFLVTYIDPNTSKPPNDLVKGVGYILVRGYREGTLPQMPPSGIPDARST